ncbi:hypothetical protein ACQ4WX_49980 [Streptomyces lasalocidi]
MCVIAPDGAQSEAVVQPALHHAEAEPVVVVGTAPGTLPAFLSSLYDQLHPAAPRPRQAARLQDVIEEELARRPRPAVVIHNAHLLRNDLVSIFTGSATPSRTTNRACPSSSSGPNDSRLFYQLVIRPGTRRALAFAALAFTQRGLAPGHPRGRQLLDQSAEMCSIKAAESRVGQSRAGPVVRHNITNP